MKKKNSRWGSKRIMGELLKCGVKLCKRTISKILKEYGFDPRKRNTSYSWFQFLKSQGKRFYACDFFTVETLFFQRRYAFFIIDTNTREIVLFSVTSSPCEYWLKNVLRSYFSFVSFIPDVLISDRDGIYGKWLKPFLKEYFGIKLVKIPPYLPVCNCFAERMVRTFREELLDHLIFYNENDLCNILKEYVEYYNKSRTHSSLEFHATLVKFTTNELFHPKKVKRKKFLDGLITDFQLAA